MNEKYIQYPAKYSSLLSLKNNARLQSKTTYCTYSGTTQSPPVVRNAAIDSAPIMASQKTYAEAAIQAPTPTH